jgi:hypothetical protein
MMSHNFIPTHFSIQELLPPPVFLPEPMRKVFFSSPEKLFRCFDPKVLLTADLLRKRYGRCVVNNWTAFSEDEYNDLSQKHIFRFSGFRPWECEEGAPLSEHRMFRAFDCKFAETTPAEIWEDMQRDLNRKEFEHIQRIEAFDGMSWFHFDTGQHELYGEAVRVIPHHGNRAGLPEYLKRS